MQVHVENTPNPLVKKFSLTDTANKPLGPYSDLHIGYRNSVIPFGESRTIEDAKRECPLAATLLGAGVLAISLDQGPKGSFVTIGIKESQKHLWPKVEAATITILNDHLGGGKSAFTQAFKPSESQEEYHKRVLSFIDEKYGAKGTDIVEPLLQVMEALTPRIKSDGGNLKFQAIDFNTNKVYVEMSGACSGCSKTSDTLGNIANALDRHLGIKLDIVNTAKEPNKNLSPGVFAFNG